MVETEIGNGMRKKLAAMLLLSWGYVCMAQGVSIEWKTDPVDGHRTGVVASNADNVLQSMGYVKGRTYHSPNGRKFRGGTTPKVARIMLGCQDEMAKVKQVIGYSTREMVREYPECEIYDWYVDELMRAVADSTGKKVDIGFTNRGGVRIDMPRARSSTTTSCRCSLSTTTSATWGFTGVKSRLSWTRWLRPGSRSWAE
jgi:hypothetical protein